VCDCVVGIIDPLRGDVKEAVKTAQEAGVIVRMVTGDNIATASAIARQCGILGPDDIAVEGPNFRKMTPKAVDAILPRLRVMARSSPDDKYLLVTRLNGHGVPSTKEEWEEKHKAKVGVTWETHKDLLLPGYREEWEEARPDCGDIVGSFTADDYCDVGDFEGRRSVSANGSRVSQRSPAFHAQR
jgi:hypothetical protein